MAALATPTHRPPSAGAAQVRLTRAMPANTAPIVAAVDGTLRDSQAIRTAAARQSVRSWSAAASSGWRWQLLCASSAWPSP
jgi:hypothetical protein